MTTDKTAQARDQLARLAAVECLECDGSGWGRYLSPSNTDAVESCPDCNGTGCRWPGLSEECTFDASEYIGQPIGMFHCPFCGEMILAMEGHQPPGRIPLPLVTEADEDRVVGALVRILERAGDYDLDRRNGLAYVYGPERPEDTNCLARDESTTLALLRAVEAL